MEVLQSYQHDGRRRHVPTNPSLARRPVSRAPQPLAHDALSGQAHREGKCNEPQVERETLAAKIQALQPAAVAGTSAREKL